MGWKDDVIAEYDREVARREERSAVRRRREAVFLKEKLAELGIDAEPESAEVTVDDARFRLVDVLDFAWVVRMTDEARWAQKRVAVVGRADCGHEVTDVVRTRAELGEALVGPPRQVCGFKCLVAPVTAALG